MLIEDCGLREMRDWLTSVPSWWESRCPAGENTLHTWYSLGGSTDPGPTSHCHCRKSEQCLVQCFVLSWAQCYLLTALRTEPLFLGPLCPLPGQSLLLLSSLPRLGALRSLVRPVGLTEYIQKIFSHLTSHILHLISHISHLTNLTSLPSLTTHIWMSLSPSGWKSSHGISHRYYNLRTCGDCGPSDRCW